MLKKSFSLVELVITIAFFSVGITVIMESFSFSARLSRLSAQMAAALLLAEDKLQELEYREGRGALTAAGEAGREGEFSWQYGFQATTVSPLLYLLNFEVNWSSNHRQQALNIDTYLMKPEA